MTTISSWGDLTNYSADPWENVTTNERQWYDPYLRNMYLHNAVYSPLTGMKVDMNGPAARTITFTEIIPPRPNIAPLAARAVDSNRLYSDTAAKRVTTARYGGGMGFHKESEMFTYFKQNGQVQGLRWIIEQTLGTTIAIHMDTLARNAFFAHPNPIFGGASAKSGLNVLDHASNTADKMSTDFVDAMWLMMGTRPKLFAPSAQSEFSPTGEETVCVTTRGAIYDLKREVGTGTGGLNFVEINRYSETGRRMLLTGELGSYRGMRFVESPMATLWNTGTIEAQTTIKAALKPGDGAADPATTAVDGVLYVGQPGATHYVKVNDSTGLNVGDRVTIHRLRHDGGSLATYKNVGVTNGVRYDDPMAQSVEIESIDTSGGSGDHHVVLREPYMQVAETGSAGLETDLGAGVFGYMTKAKHVSSALFMTPGQSQDGVIAGIAKLPEIIQPPAIDDFMSYFRISYEFWLKYQIWNPRKFNVAYFTAPLSLGGTTLVR